MIFDMDGVICHTNPFHSMAFKEFFAKRNLFPTEEEFAAHMYRKSNSYIMSHFFGRKIEGEELLKRVNQKVAVSSGSACTSISPKPSHVLKAMGLDPDLGRASIRFSLGRKTSEDEILQTIDWVEKVVKELRE